MQATKSVAKTKSKEMQLSAFVKSIVRRVIYFLLGVIISRGGVVSKFYPFAPAFVAAVPRRFTLSATMGSMLGYILLNPTQSFRYMAVVVAISALKWLLSDFGNLSKSSLFAPLITFVPMIATGIVMLYVSTSNIADFGDCIVETLIASASAYFIYRSTQVMTSNRGLSGMSPQEVACLTISACIVMLSFGTLEVWGVSVGRLLAVITVLLFARYGGVAGGSIAGISTGVVFSFTGGQMFFLAGGYAFGGLVGGMFSALGGVYVALAFALCNIVTALAADSGMILSLTIECLLGAGVFLLIPADFGNNIRSLFVSDRVKEKSEAMRRSITTRLDHAAFALEGVTSCVNEVAKKIEKTAEISDDMAIFELALKNTCASCGLKVYCWDKQKELTKDDFCKLSVVLRKEGYINEKDINDNFVKKCCKQRELCRNINESYTEYLSKLSAQRRIAHMRSVVADQFTGLSDMLWDLSEEFEVCDKFDVDSAEIIVEKLKKEDVLVSDCSCRVDRGKGMTVELELICKKRNDVDRKLVHKIVSRTCARRFDSAIESVAGNRLRLALSEISHYDVDIGTAVHIASNGALCGDCTDYFMNGMGSMVAIISDGMGSGGAAAVDSNLAVMVLTKLIRAGISYDCALSVVNSALMIKSEEESMATMDVVDINLYTGKVSFLKAGAPVTFVCKNGRIYRREFPSLPVGILNEVKFVKDAMTLSENDAILMVSDGVLSGDDKWLEDLLVGWKDAPAQDFADIIVSEAIKRRNEPHDDDISAIAIKLIANE